MNEKRDANERAVARMKRLIADLELMTDDEAEIFVFLMYVYVSSYYDTKE